MERPALPQELVWTGELRLSILVPPEWNDADQVALDETLARVALEMADALRRSLPPFCTVESSVL